MRVLRKIISWVFILSLGLALWHCAKRGSPSGGPKDETPPVLLRSIPEQMTTNFEGDEIRLYFDEYVKLQDVQNQLIVSPPLKYQPVITPQGSASKVVKIEIKDTLRPNTTYTFNFGQSIVDNNEGNPAPFLTYVMSTGDFIDSLTVKGEIKDAFNREPDNFVSVMLYEIDSTFSDSTIYKEPPTYITNTLDSATTFELRNLKEGIYAIYALKDIGRNNIFDQDADKIAFLSDTITLPTDTTYTLKLFREIPNYSLQPPNFAAANKIIFGYTGEEDSLKITPITTLPDTTKTLITKIPDADSLVFWFTPLDLDSIIFKVENQRLDVIDTVVVKTRKLEPDSLVVTGRPSGLLEFGARVNISASTPLVTLDTSALKVYASDSLEVLYDAQIDSKENEVVVQFEKEPNTPYRIEALPELITDFFGNTNDSLIFSANTGSYADFGNLRVILDGELEFPIILQLTEMNGDVVREFVSDSTRVFDFTNLLPRTYLVRLILDGNGSGDWDTGNHLAGIQPERVVYFEKEIEVRANWELVETFSIE